MFSDFFIHYFHLLAHSACLLKGLYVLHQVRDVIVSQIITKFGKYVG